MDSVGPNFQPLAPISLVSPPISQVSPYRSSQHQPSRLLVPYTASSNVHGTGIIIFQAHAFRRLYSLLDRCLEMAVMV